MRLRELDATFLKLLDPNGASHSLIGDQLAGADGVQFLCPLCFVKNKGRVGTHSVICWFSHVPLHIDPKPGRWMPSGTGLDDLTFVPWAGHSTSVALNPDVPPPKPGEIDVCRWHGFVTRGDAT